jgi:bacillopeptidase F
VYLIGSFQWALDPDGDTATSSDVPHVINNSWRWRDQLDTVQCGGFIVQLMNAIEAAGIANVFSGGNTGPSNSMLNSPQRIKSNPVNVFSVGSVNGNVAFPQPISGFSTRGPSQCPSNGTLNIHPEVVAPGENVRSAWGMDGYNSISGTSMSSPHVSGAVLLLKEAFPQLTGAQLLTALYTTATDMGVTGEDNVYGNGLIDVHSAFLWLAQQHTPRDPLQPHYDLSVRNLQSQDGRLYGCDSLVQLDLILENKGNLPLNQVQVEVSVNGTSQSTATYSVQLPAQGSVDTLRFSAIAWPDSGANEIQAVVSIDSVDYDPVNNAGMFRYHRLPKILRWMGSVLLDEYFFDGLRSDIWYVENPDLGMTWDTITVGPGQQRSVWMNMSDYDPAANQKDRLISPAIQFLGDPLIDVAYAYRPLGPISFLHDTFRIYVSTDCGQHFDHLLFEAFGDQLATTSNYGSNFYPTSGQDWGGFYMQGLMDSVFPVPSSGRYPYDDYLVFAFETTNRKGNNFFLRKITIQQTWISAESFAHDFRLFPNPSSGRFELHAEGQEGRTFSWSLLDMQGRNLRSGSFVGSRCVFDLGDLSDGVYQLTLSNSDRIETHRLVKASD